MSSAHSPCLLEGHAVLSAVSGGLSRIPGEAVNKTLSHTRHSERRRSLSHVFFTTVAVLAEGSVMVLGRLPESSNIFFGRHWQTASYAQIGRSLLNTPVHCQYKELGADCVPVRGERAGTPARLTRASDATGAVTLSGASAQRPKSHRRGPPSWVPANPRGQRAPSTSVPASGSAPVLRRIEPI